MLDFSVTLVITIINIVILTFILKAILWKPVTKFMAERARRVQDSIDQSEKDKAKANALLARYAGQMETAETLATAIIVKAKEQARLEAEKIIASGRASAEDLLANARKQLEMEKKAAMAAFRRDAAALVVAAASRLVGREINGEDNQRYAAMLLKEAAPLLENASED